MIHLKKLAPALKPGFFIWGRVERMEYQVEG
jgi:hypothetical protein